MAKGLAKGTLKITTTTVEPNLVASGFPNYMCLSTCGSLIPQKSSTWRPDDIDTVFDAYCYHQYRFDLIINSEKEKSDIDDIRGYATVQYKSNLYTAEDREASMLETGLFDASEQPYQIRMALRAIIQCAAKKWREFYKE